MLTDALSIFVSSIANSLGSNLTSVFLVGSMASENYTIRENNDLDLRILVNNVNKQVYQCIKDNIDILVCTLRNNQIDVTESDLIGPVRYLSNNTNNYSMLIHWIVLDSMTLCTLPKLHQFSYSQNYKILFGYDEIGKYRDLRYTIDNICNDPEGINHCIKMLESCKLKYQVWSETKNGEMILVDAEEDMNDSMLLETLRYSLTKSFLNCANYFRWQGLKINVVSDLLNVLSIDVENEVHIMLEMIKKRDYRHLNTRTTIPIFCELLKVISNKLCNYKNCNI